MDVPRKQLERWLVEAEALPRTTGIIPVRPADLAAMCREILARRDDSQERGKVRMARKLFNPALKEE